MKWFRPAVRPYHVALSMIGAKTADRVLVLGARDGGLAAELGVTTGLNGRTLVVDTAPGAAEAVEAAAVKAGALLDFARASTSAVPEADEAFDVVVLNHALGPLSGPARADVCVETLRVLRPGGRLIAIEPTRRPGLLGLARAAEAPTVSGPELMGLAQTAGFRGVRILSETEGLVFVEATRGR